MAEINLIPFILNNQELTAAI